MSLKYSFVWYGCSNLTWFVACCYCFRSWWTFQDFLISVKKWPEKLRRYAPTKENLVEPYLSVNQQQSISISINKHQSASSSIFPLQNLKQLNSQFCFFLKILIMSSFLLLLLIHRRKHFSQNFKPTQQLVLLLFFLWNFYPWAWFD